MTTHAEWMISRLEAGETVKGLFDYKRLEHVRATLEARYSIWPTEIRIKDGMMELTPTEAFIKK